MKPGDLIRIKPTYKNRWGVSKGFHLFDLEGGLRECGTFPKDDLGIFVSHKHTGSGYSYVEVIVNGVFGSIAEDFIEVVE